MIDWSKVNHFVPSEFPNWSLGVIVPDLIYQLDEMRSTVGKRFIVHCAYENSGHTTTSQHYIGRAVDFHIKGLNILDQAIWALQFPWNGIGIYPFWNSPGLHCDIRRLKKYEKRKVWWRDGKGKYLIFDDAFVKWLVSAGGR